MLDMILSNMYKCYLQVSSMSLVLEDIELSGNGAFEYRAKVI